MAFKHSKQSENTLQNGNIIFDTNYDKTFENLLEDLPWDFKAEQVKTTIVLLLFSAFNSFKSLNNDEIMNEIISARDNFKRFEIFTKNFEPLEEEKLEFTKAIENILIFYKENAECYNSKFMNNISKFFPEVDFKLEPDFTLLQKKILSNTEDTIKEVLTKPTKLKITRTLNNPENNLRKLLSDPEGVKNKKCLNLDDNLNKILLAPEGEIVKVLHEALDNKTNEVCTLLSNSLTYNIYNSESKKKFAEDFLTLKDIIPKDKRKPLLEQRKYYRGQSVNCVRKLHALTLCFDICFFKMKDNQCISLLKDYMRSHQKYLILPPQNSKNIKKKSPIPVKTPRTLKTLKQSKSYEFLANSTSSDSLNQKGLDETCSKEENFVVILLFLLNLRAYNKCIGEGLIHNYNKLQNACIKKTYEKSLFALVQECYVYFAIIKDFILSLRFVTVDSEFDLASNVNKFIDNIRALLNTPYFRTLIYGYYNNNLCEINEFMIKYLIKKQNR